MTSRGRQDATVLSGLTRSTVSVPMRTEDTFPNEDAELDRPGRAADLTLRDAMLVKISWIRSFLAVAERGDQQADLVQGEAGREGVAHGRSLFRADAGRAKRIWKAANKARRRPGSCSTKSSCNRPDRICP